MSLDAAIRIQLKGQYIVTKDTTIRKTGQLCCFMHDSANHCQGQEVVARGERGRMMADCQSLLDTTPGRSMCCCSLIINMQCFNNGNMLFLLKYGKTILVL